MDTIGIGIVVIGGFVLLALVMMFVIRKNDTSDVPMSRTEKATDDLYEEIHDEEERKYHKDEDKPA